MLIKKIKRADNPQMWNFIKKPGYYVCSTALLVTDVSRAELAAAYSTFMEIIRELEKANGEFFPESYDIIDPTLPEGYEDSFEEETDEYRVFLVGQDDYECAEFYTTGNDYPDLLFAFDLKQSMLRCFSGGAGYDE